MSKLAIIVVTYNRMHCLKRLLNALENADYENDTIDLIISVDKSNDSAIELFAEDFLWTHGKKDVRTHKENLGLRKHILECGNLVSDYDAIAMFEDDILPSEYFYAYFKQSVEFFESDNRIAGISLYKHLWNVGNYSYFEPEVDPEFDNYFMQYAQSWGQIWTKRMWTEFYDWYLQQNGDYDKTTLLPDNVNNWPKSSWLKYNIKYLVEKNKYFVYPYNALSTNCGEAGVHNNSSPNYQVPLLNKKISKYNFCDLDTCNITYDAFFERLEIANHLGIGLDEICIDLYSLKNNDKGKRYWITTKQLNFKILKAYSLALKPIEMNILKDYVGDEIFLYDTKCIEKNLFSLSKKDVEYRRLVYSSKDIHLKDMLLLTYNDIIKVMKRKILRRR